MIITEKLIESIQLNELGYRDLANDMQPNSVAGAHLTSIATRDWSPLIPWRKYLGCTGNTMRFLTANKYNGWEVYFRWDDWYDQVNDLSLNCNEAARLIFWGSNLRIHCLCPSFSFHGYQYVATELDSAIFPETRFPAKNNPELRFGGGCKHTRVCLKSLAFSLGDMASAIKEQRRAIR